MMWTTRTRSCPFAVRVVLGVLLCLTICTDGFIQMVSISGTKAAFIFPIDVPNLMQDPQNLPRPHALFFGMEQGGTINVKLHLSRILPPAPLRGAEISSDTVEASSDTAAASSDTVAASSDTVAASSDTVAASSDTVAASSDTVTAADKTWSPSWMPLSAVRRASQQSDIEVGVVVVKHEKSKSSIELESLGSGVMALTGWVKRAVTSIRSIGAALWSEQSLLRSAVDRGLHPQGLFGGLLDGQQDFISDEYEGLKDSDSLRQASSAASAADIEFLQQSTGAEGLSLKDFVSAAYDSSGVGDSVHLSDEQSIEFPFKTAAAALIESKDSFASYDLMDNAAVEDVYLFVLEYEQWVQTQFAFSSYPARTFNNNTGRNVWSSQIRSYLKIALTSSVDFSHTFRFSGEYFVFILNAREDVVSIKGQIWLVNPGGQHLSTNQLHEGSTSLFLFALYLSMCVALLSLIAVKWPLNRQTPIHSLMLATAAVRSVYLGIDGLNAMQYSTYGHLDLWRWVLPRMLGKIEDILSLLLFLLLALGWRVFRPTLTLLEVRLCTALCVISFYLGVFEVSMGQFQISRYILHAMTYLCIIVAASFDLAILSSHTSELGVSLATGESYRKLRAYNIFRWTFVVFIVKPTILLLYKMSVLETAAASPASAPKDDWIILLLDNLFDFGILTSLVYAFKPVTPLRVFKVLLSEDTSQPQPIRTNSTERHQPMADDTLAGTDDTGGARQNPHSNRSYPPTAVQGVTSGRVTPRSSTPPSHSHTGPTASGRPPRSQQPPRTGTSAQG